MMLIGEPVEMRVKELVVGDPLVQPRVHAGIFVFARSVREVIVRAALAHARLVCHRIVGKQLRGDRIDWGRRNDIARQCRANIACGSGRCGGVESRGCWVVDHDQVSVRVLGLREIAGALERRGHGPGERSGRGIAQTFEGHEEKRLVAAVIDFGIRTGPPKVPPNWLRRNAAIFCPALSALNPSASRSLLRRYS